MGQALQITPGTAPTLAVQLAKSYHNATGKKVVIKPAFKDSLKKAEVWDDIKEHVEVDKPVKN